jgi:hypothetical protein
MHPKVDPRQPDGRDECGSYQADWFWPAHAGARVATRTPRPSQNRARTGHPASGSCRPSGTLCQIKERLPRTSVLGYQRAVLDGTRRSIGGQLSRDLPFGFAQGRPSWAMN